MSGAAGSKAANRVLNGDTVTRTRKSPARARAQQAAGGQTSGEVLPFLRRNCFDCPVDDYYCVDELCFFDDAGYYWDDCM